MKRWMKWATAAAVTVSLTGCNKPNTTASAAPDGKRRKIGVSVPKPDHGWMGGANYWAKQAMEAHPEVDWVFTPADNSGSQVTDIESMLARGVDGLVILANDSTSLTPAAKAAHEKGVFIVNVDRGFTEPVADIFLQGDNKVFGRKSAEYVAEKMGHKGNLVILEGIVATDVNKDRVDTAKAVFAKDPGIEIVGEEETGWQEQNGLSKMNALLAKNPHIDAVWAQDDDVADGAIKAIQSVHREGEMFVFGGAGKKEFVKRVIDGDKLVPADITYPPSMVGTAVHMAASALRDGKVKTIAPMLPRHLTLDVEVITKDNAKDFYFPDSAY